MKSQLSPDQPDTEAEPAFEIALERGQPALTTALAKYETGLRLLNHCHAVLDRAERSVAVLTGVDEDGLAQTAPFDAAATDKRK
jgi:exodeoxyribonuclease VII small subunit